MGHGNPCSRFPIWKPDGARELTFPLPYRNEFRVSEGRLIMNDMNDPQKAFEPDFLVDSPSVGDDALLRLQAKMQRALGREAKERTGFERDEDPKAIFRIDPREHPLQRFIDESTPTESNQRNLRNRVRACYRLIVGMDGLIPWQKLYEYPWHLLSIEDIERFEHGLADAKYKPASRNAYRTTLRTIVHNCRRAGLISAGRAQVLLDRLSLERFERPVVGRAISPEELLLILRSLEHEDVWRMARDRALVAILATTGVRVSELCNMMLSDLDLTTGWISISMTKNGSPHRVPVAQSVRPYLSEWLEHRGDQPGHLLLAVPTRFDSPMCMQVVKRALDRATEAAGIAHCTAHDFRRTLATNLLRTHDPSVVMRLLNHRSLNSTLVYDRASDDLQAVAVDSLPLPDMGALSEDVA